MASPSGTGGTAKEAQSELGDYVTEWMKPGGTVDGQRLADLVTADPAFQRLDAEEWWNVALILAFEVRRAR